MTLRAVATNEEPEEEGQLAIFESRPVSLFLLAVQGIKEFVPVLNGEPAILHDGDRIVIQVEAEVEEVTHKQKRKPKVFPDGSILRIPVGRFTRKHIAKSIRATLVSVEEAEPAADLYGDRREG